MSFPHAASQLLTHLPMAVVLLAGLVLLAIRQLPKSSKALAIGGCGLLLLGLLASLAWSLSITTLIPSMDAEQFGVVSFVVGILLTVLQAFGFALVIAAVLTGRNQPAEAPGAATAARPETRV